MPFHRGDRRQLPDAKPFHLLLCREDKERLERLSESAKMTGADVIRALIREASQALEARAE